MSKHTKFFIRKIKRNTALEKPMRRWERNIKMDLKWDEMV